MANIYTDAGEAFTTDLIDGTASAPADWYIAWGTGAGTAAKDQTTLFTEAAETRVIAVNSQPVADTNRFVGTITAAGAKEITNAGVFTASTVGTMLLKSDFAGVALDVGDKIEFTFNLEWT